MAVAQSSETAEGEFHYSISDHFSHDRSEDHFEIQDLQTGKITKLKFLKKPGREIQHGMKVRVRGVKKNEEIMVESIEPISGGSTASDGSSSSSSALVPVTERKVLVLIVNLSNANSIFTASGIASQLFLSTNSVAKRYERLSMGHLRLNGDANGDGQPDVFGPFTINLTAPNCNENQWTAAADAAAQAAGINFSMYTNIVYAMPLYSTLGCPFRPKRLHIHCW